MSDDYVPTSPWPRDDVLDAALVDAIRAALAQQPSKPSTLTKIRAHLKAARRLPRSVKTCVEISASGAPRQFSPMTRAEGVENAP